MKKERFLSVLLTLALAFSLAVPASAYHAGNLIPQKKTNAPAFADTKGTWCEAAVATCYEAGLLDGKSAQHFAPKDSLTYAQITVITARLLNLLSGGDGAFHSPDAGEAWYQPAGDYLAAQLGQREETSYATGYLLDNLSFLDGQAQSPCTRYDFVWYLAAILPESALSPINQISTLPDEQDEDILRFYNAGILTGSDAYGTFRGLDTLNRGQAAAMLARVIDKTQRVSFTPEILVFARDLLSLAPETPVLTVDGYTVNAETYTYFLLQNVSLAQMEHYFSFYETYPEEFEAYLADDAYMDFSKFMREKCGVDITAPIDWNAPDQGGLTPAQKVRETTLDDVKRLASLLNHEKSYPLTAEQTAQLQENLTFYFGSTYGFSDALTRTLAKSYFIQENLTDSVSLSAAEVNQYLKDAGYLYGQYVVLLRGEESHYDTDASALEAAQTVRAELIAHKDDSEYLQYLFWKYSDEYTADPGILPLEELSMENRQTLEQLPIGQVSGVLKEDTRYLVVLKLDPSADASILQSAAEIPAQTTMDAWVRAAKVTPAAAYHAIDIGKAAAAYLALNK